MRSGALDIEARLIGLLPKKYILVYSAAVKCSDEQDDNSPRKIEEEWYYRCHLLVDYIAGMTDRYALETYQMLEGIRI